MERIPTPRVKPGSGATPVKEQLTERLSLLRNKAPSLSWDSSATLSTSGSYDSTNESSTSNSSESEEGRRKGVQSKVCLNCVSGEARISSITSAIASSLIRTNSKTSTILASIVNGVTGISRSDSDEPKKGEVDDAQLGDSVSPSTLIRSPSFSEDSFSTPLDKKSIPTELLNPGFQMLRVTHRKKIKRFFRLDLDENRLYWNSKASSFLEVEKIKSIRVGDDARNYREEFKVSAKYRDLWITVIYHNYSKSNNIKALHIIATNKTDYDQFLSTLSNLVYFRRQLQAPLYSATGSNLFTKFHWNNNISNRRASEEPDRLYFAGVLKLATKLHINVERETLLGTFEDSDGEGKGYLNFEEFKHFVKTLRQRREFSSIFNNFGSNGKMSREEFGHFLSTEQHEEPDNYGDIFACFANGKEFMNLDDFGSFLVSPYTVAFKTIKEDPTRPLNEYYISSSHNTYLLGRQFNGISSIEGYIRALQRGCRCIEIDIWDGENGPVVTHGRTFSGSVDFRLVIETIRKYSFITSPFPVILSLETRCSKENQLICVSILKEVLQDLLLSYPTEEDDILPSPLDLKHRILVKVKKSKTVALTRGKFDSSSLSSSSTTSLSLSDDSVPLPMSPSSSSYSSRITKIIPKSRKSVPVVSELTSMAMYTLGLKFRNFSLPESKTFNHCFSFSDKTVTKMLKETTKFNAIMKHNRNFLMRIYPSLYRFMSDNFNPLAFWSLGCQMAATNWQVYDAGQQINEALFGIDSCSGYVLKPKALRMNRKRFRKMEDFESVLKFDRLNFLEIGIISAQQLPKTKDMKTNGAFDPYIEVELYSGKVIDSEVRKGITNCISTGSPQIKVKTDSMSSDREFDPQQIIDLGTPSAVFRTSVVSKNGFNPLWNESFRFTYYANQIDLVFLRFLVKCQTPDHSDVLLGIHCCKLDYLKEGYRHLPVYDLQGEEFIYSSMFLHIGYGGDKMEEGRLLTQRHDSRVLS
ncbi:DEKNAAC103821 [Brettanomyces naardenensis]|uniref:Phosphoinositide phospholipase C n=1 Tax=Brettanomyces naardenensis TaxID=13370 RepID=A0A448YPE7_BRENA|nr:DEKNAAC103821 [Brettanomyces naardenensis]